MVIMTKRRSTVLFLLAGVCVLIEPSLAQVSDPAGVFTVTGCPLGPVIGETSGNFAQIYWNLPTAASSAGSIDSNIYPELTAGQNSGGFFGVNSATTITYRWIDSFGNEATCTFLVRAQRPNIFTMLTCPPTNLVFTSSTRVATWNTPPFPTSISESVSLYSQSHSSGGVFLAGDTTVLYTWKDTANNFAQCEFMVDQLVIQCPSPVVTAQQGQTSANVPFTATASGGTPGYSFAYTPTANQPNTVFNIGTTQVTATVTDAAGGTATCTFNVEVNAAPEGTTAAPTTTDPCASHMCQNGGTCVLDSSDQDGYTCSCVPGYDGDRCENDINECDPHPCNDGQCIDGINDFTCNCTGTGYKGDLCETDIDECDTLAPCVNGNCTNTDGSYNCTCDSGWEGKNCDEDIDECSTSMPCQNGATCEDIDGSYNCICIPGFIGKDCEENPDDCTPNPCYNNVPCTDGNDDYTCDCTDTGYKGKNCSEDIDECAEDSDTCSDYANCTNTVPYYTCTCNDGYQGNGYVCTECQEGSYGEQCGDVCTCVENPTPGTCDHVTGKCTCSPAFDGAACDKMDLTVTVEKLQPTGTVVQGDTLILQCFVNLNILELQDYKVVWTYPKGSTQDGTFINNGEYQLIVPNVNPADHKGDFNCTASTLLQTGELYTVTNALFVDVIAPGEISEVSPDAMIELYETAELWCKVYGSPPPDVEWKRLRDNMILEDGDENGRIMVSKQVLDQYYAISTLGIANITNDDNGQYVCTAKNNKGGDNETLEIFVLEAPLIVVDSLMTQDQSTIRITWRVTFDGNLELDFCTADYQELDEMMQPIGEVMKYMFEVPQDDVSADIRGLNPYTLYAVNLTCNNSVGYSNTAPGNTTRTGKYRPSAPRQVESSSITKTSVQLQWLEPEIKNGDISFYRIELESDKDNQVIDTKDNSEFTSVTGLLPGTMYNVFISAVNTEEDGDEFVGNRSDVHTFETSPDVPDPPTNVKSMDEPEMCTISWGPPDVTNGDITGYKIHPMSQGRGSDAGDPIKEDIVERGPDDRSYVFVKADLRPYSKYDFTVTASTSAGDSRPSDPVVSCFTEPDTPEPPPRIEPLPAETPDLVTKTSFKLNIPAPDKRNGDVSCYEVIIVPLEGNAFNPDVDPDVEYPPDSIQSYEDSKARAGNPYLAMVLKGNSITGSVIVTIGDDLTTTCDDIDVGSNRRKRAEPEMRQATNGPVREGTKYTAFTRSYVLVGDEVKHSSSPILAEPITTPSTGTNVAAIVVPIIMILLLIIIVLLVFLIYRRRQQDKPDGLTPNEENGTHMQLGYVNPGMQPDVFDIQVGPCPIGQLENEYLRRIANGNAMFQAEFKSLPESTGNITKEASLNEINKDKNRYINIIAYDQTRVRLQEIEDEPGSDYINACYVDGYKHPAKFIASQGPREDTVNDFWRMVWEQNSTTIVMLTKCFEHGKEKCAQYWPDAGTGTYGPLTVTCEDNVTCCDYVIRKFSVAEVEDEEGIHARSVTQFHYLGWPDFGAPEYPYSVLSFLKRVRQMTYAKSDKGNIVIHCSAGVGRTGTYILIDTMIEMIANEKKVDIYNFIYKIRSQRNLLVQSIVQYIFIHRALVEEYKFGHTEVDLMNLTKYYLTLTKPDPETQKSGVDKEYRMVASQHVEDTKQEWGNKEANKEKNRLRQVVPYDRNRVKLERMIGEEHSDYINASFIHGYENRRAYVATQGPLPKTASDFWRMVWEEQSSTIVMLTKLSERGQEVCHRYWPDQGDSSTQSYLAIQHVNESDQGEYIVRDFQLTNTKGGGLRNIRQYHFQDWPEVGMPESGVSLIKLIGEAHKHQKNINQFPIIVHGSSGAGRTGVFCALSILLARIQAEGVVDVFQTVRTLRQQRPHMVQDPTQYQFCYKAVLNHLDSYGTYANYK